MDRRGRPKTHCRVHIVNPEFGRARVRIRNARLHANAIACFQVGYCAADFGNCACSLMPQNHWLLNHKRANLAMRIVVHIAATYADCINVDPDIVFPKAAFEVDITQGQLSLFF